jgi:hypothetical protein
VNESGDNPAIHGAVTTWVLRKITSGYLYPQDAANSVLTGLPAMVVSTKQDAGALSTTPVSPQARKPCLYNGTAGTDEIWCVWASSSSSTPNTTPVKTITDGAYLYLQKGIDPSSPRNLGEYCAQFVVADATMRDSDINGAYGILNYINLSRVSNTGKMTGSRFGGNYTKVKTLSYVASSITFTGPVTNLTIPQDSAVTTFDALYETTSSFVVTLDFTTFALGIPTHYNDQRVEMSLTAPGPVTMGAAIQNILYCVKNDLSGGNVRFNFSQLLVNFQTSNGVCKNRTSCNVIPSSNPFANRGGITDGCSSAQICTTWNSNANADAFSKLTFGKGPQAVAKAVGAVIFDKINTALLSSLSNATSVRTIPVSLPKLKI